MLVRDPKLCILQKHRRKMVVNKIRNENFTPTTRVERTWIQKMWHPRYFSMAS
jgi:hypothetical protein